MKRLFLHCALFLILVMVTPSIFAQGCAACKANAAQAGAQAQRGLRRGIVVLLVPSLLIFSSLIFLAYKHREQ